MNWFRTYSDTSEPCLNLQRRAACRCADDDLVAVVVQILAARFDGILQIKIDRCSMSPEVGISWKASITCSRSRFSKSEWRTVVRTKGIGRFVCSPHTTQSADDFQQSPACWIAPSAPRDVFLRVTDEKCNTRIHHARCHLPRALRRRALSHCRP